MFELPDCSGMEDFRVELSSQEEQELVQKLAKQGERAIDDIVRKQMQRKEILEKVQKMRKDLEQQSQEIRESKHRRYLQHQKELEEKFQDRMASLKNKKNSAIEDYQNYKDQELSQLELALLDDNLIKMVVDDFPAGVLPEKGGLLQRFWEWLKAFLTAIARAIVSFCKRILSFFRRKKKGPLGPREQRIMLLSGSAFGGVLSDFDGRLFSTLQGNKKFKKELEKEMKQQGKLTIKERLDRERYLGAARSIMENRVQEKVGKTKEEQEEQKRRLQEEIDRLLKKQEEEKQEQDLENTNLKKAYKEEKKRFLHELDEYPERLLKEGLKRDLKKMGYINRDGEFAITSELIERFASILLSHELQALPSATLQRFGRSDKREGIYEKDRLLSLDEVSRMDIVESLIHSRISHPKEHHIRDEDIIVNREHSESQNHVVIAIDTSYSMVENQRMEAAKKAVLALYKAIKQNNPKNRIDIIGFNTHVSVLNLAGVWKAEPRGFTNTAGVLRTARLLFQDSKDECRLLYLITDGLPEAYTDKEGNDVVDDPETCLPYAVKEGRRLDATLVMLLLEPQDELYLKAAKRIVRAAPKSRVMITDPRKLAKDMLADFILS